MPRTARIITEICSPWVTNLLFFGCLGWGTQQFFPGAIAGLITGPGVMAGIGVMMRLGFIGDHHVTKGQERKYAFAWIAVCLAAVLVFFAVTGVNHQLWGAFIASTIFIASYVAMMKAGWKTSIHVGLWVCCCIYLAWALSLWWLVALLAVPAIAWSRVELGEHSVKEVSTGALAGIVLGTVISVLVL